MERERERGSERERERRAAQTLGYVRSSGGEVESGDGVGLG